MTDHDDTTRIAAVFAENVRREMRVLAPDTVADLTDGLEADIVASLADGGSLPDPVEYARDLMRAAGIDVPGSHDGGILAGARRFALRVFGAARAWTRGLAPAWWVIRAWVLMQMLGFAVSRTDSPWWFLGQWGGEGLANGFVGVVFFVAFLVASVRIGRDGWLLSRRHEKVVSAVIAVFALFVLFSFNTWSPYPGYFGYQPTMGTEVPTRDCQAMPDLGGYSVIDAIGVITEMGLPSKVIDQATMNDITNLEGIAEPRVVRQTPAPHDMACGHTVVLYVELKQPLTTYPDGSPDSIQQSVIPAPTTTVWFRPADLQTTTTTPTPKSRATTTTTP